MSHDAPPPPSRQTPIPVEPIGPGVQPAFTDEHFRQWQAAEVAVRKIRRTVGVARFDGWTIAIFAGLTLACGLTDVSNVLMAAGMGAVAFVELRAAGRLARLDATAARTLALNQVALAGLLIVYAVWRLIGVARGDAVASMMGHLDADMMSMVGDVAGTVRQVLFLVYGILIAVAVFGQGGMALYYVRRGAFVRRYVEETPGWVISMQRTSAGGFPVG